MEVEELESPASSRRNKEADPMIIEDGSSPRPAPAPAAASFSLSLCCSHCFGLRRPRRAPRPFSSSSFWERIGSSHFDRRWWAPGVRVLKKLRELSEVVAGPRWKTFIRRFSRSRSIGSAAGAGGGAHDQSRPGRFNYDPMSYALNFDEGPGHDPHLDDEDYFRRYRSFSVRHASVPGGGHSAAEEDVAGKGKDAMAVAVA
ncbi:uncharacterized protein LOC115691748 [Syzygium oleosum]|uniref:uncharacterized protein LOC115691748 n=1 Tax=Syzygium oleosum TaxID=219896 RepID=UPI0024B9DD58|nr:uncharacterized protein LOC115691748 [Syzygium oleosum]